MNPKKKPDYDPEEILEALTAATVDSYEETRSLHKTAEELDLNVIKVQKLLLTAKYHDTARESDTGKERDTAHAYHSDTADRIEKLRKERKDGKSIAEIMTATVLSRASVNSYLPYTKVLYKADELSANAERIAKYRERKAAVEKLNKEGGTDNLWNCITAFAGYPFYTAKGLKFKYEVSGGEMKVDRKEKTVTRSSVEMAYRKACEGEITGPKKLGVFGASYLYPVFVRIGVV
ncbi:MAG: hypothetical protein LUE87_07395 [Lachnospiraceae bacterium]|nr:hypothetical protein [Lachnospiraceae bacterium]